MKDLGEANFVLGIEIHRDRDHKFLGLSQKAYVDRVLERFGKESCKPGVAPIFKGDKLNKDQCPKNDVEKATIKDIPYCSVVGSLMYSAVCTRPDIAYAVSVLGRYLANLRNEHWVAAKKVLEYLQKTKDHMLVYREVDDLQVIGYADADLAGCTDDRKSTTGFIFTLAGGVISWKSSKQSLVDSSTMEVEIVACYETGAHGKWLRNFIS